MQLLQYRKRCLPESSINNNRTQHASKSIIFLACNNLDLVGYTWPRCAAKPTVLTLINNISRAYINKIGLAELINRPITVCFTIHLPVLINPSLFLVYLVHSVFASLHLITLHQFCSTHKYSPLKIENSNRSKGASRRRDSQNTLLEFGRTRILYSICISL